MTPSLIAINIQDHYFPWDCFHIH